MSAPALDFYSLLRVLREEGVEFIVIGGFALGFHGAPRGTKDVDIVPAPGRDNVERLWAALQRLEARPVELDDFRPEEMPVEFGLNGLLEGGNWALHTRYGRLDVMQWVPGIDEYASLRAGAVAEDLPEIGAEILIAGRDDIVTMKTAAGRPQDLIDIEALRIAEGRSD